MSAITSPRRITWREVRASGEQVSKSKTCGGGTVGAESGNDVMLKRERRLVGDKCGLDDREVGRA